jgi:predicted dehydrogenase
MGQYHARAINNVDLSELSYVSDLDPLKSQDFAVRYACKVSEPERLSSQKIDFAVIATPTEYHFKYALEFLEKRIPIIVEKPLTLSFAEAQLLVEKSLERETPLMCSFVERFNPAILTARQMQLDPIAIYSVRHSPYVSRATTSVTADLLIHDIDLTLLLLGDEVTKKLILDIKNDSGISESAEVLMQFADSRTANLSASRMSQKKIRQMTIIEESRVIELDLLRRLVTVTRNIDAVATRDGLGYQQQSIVEIPNIVSSGDPLEAQLVDFLTSLQQESNWKSKTLGILSPHRVLDELLGNQHH